METADLLRYRRFKRTSMNKRREFVVIPLGYWTLVVCQYSISFWVLAAHFLNAESLKGVESSQFNSFTP